MSSAAPAHQRFDFLDARLWGEQAEIPLQGRLQLQLHALHEAVEHQAS